MSSETKTIKKALVTEQEPAPVILAPMSLLLPKKMDSLTCIRAVHTSEFLKVQSPAEEMLVGIFPVVTFVKVKVRDLRECARTDQKTEMIIELFFRKVEDYSTEYTRRSEKLSSEYCSTIKLVDSGKFCEVEQSFKDDDCVHTMKIDKVAVVSRIKDIILSKGFGIGGSVRWDFNVSCHYIENIQPKSGDYVCVCGEQNFSCDGLFPTEFPSCPVFRESCSRK